jgi:hypothetical protein
MVKIQIFGLIFSILFSGLSVCFGNVSVSTNAPSSDQNRTSMPSQIIRVIQPGVFDVQTREFIVRMRAWGVGFPQRGQPGYDQALSYTENKLVSTKPEFRIKREFDEKNLKVAEVLLLDGSFNYSRDAIALGMGWHLEKETNRYGPFLLAQLKAKRANAGIWANNFNYSQIVDPLARPSPNLPGLLNRRDTFVPGLSFWVTSFGKIHRPGCSFYQRGRGVLSSQPNGTDCRICGGRKPK